MNIYIPIADVTLTDGQTYDGQLPVWATRPLMVKVTTGTNEPVNITVRNNGSPVKTVTLPYQQYGMDIDLSFAAPLLKRADRNKSQGTPWFMQQELLFWVDDPTDYITIPVFHCDLTYWDTLGVDAALPQPPKPRIPGHTLDIFFPYVIHPSDALSVQVEPVTGAPSNVIFPVTYVLGNTIDITYIKKLTIKNVWGNGLDQVINYEDRLMSEAVYDTGLQCALRARWNMRNGQWFWAAFKDYFWSNKFITIRGRGGVTEQAEITINLEYGEEYYNVYQELLVSSNVVFDLNIPGINQYQSKRFRAEVSGDTGARWSNSTKTYRQQVRFKTTELQDNYMFPLAPDQPPTPSIAFSAQRNPWTIGPAYTEGLVNSIYSNVAWEVQSEPSWLTVTNGTTLLTLLTPDLFEQGGVTYPPGTTWEAGKVPSSKRIRLKTPFTNINNEVYCIISDVPGYKALFVYLDENGIMNGVRDWFTTEGRSNADAVSQVGLLLRKVDDSDITPADVTAINAYWGKRYHQFPAGTSNLTATVAANTGEARTGTLSLRSMAGGVSYPITINQQKASISLSPANVRVGNAYQGEYHITAVTANTDWYIDPEPSWLTVTNGTTLFKPEDFAQGGFSNYAPLTPPESWVDNSPNYIRLKKPIETLSEVYSLISAASGYQVQVYYLNSAGTGATSSVWFNAGVGRRNLEAYSGFLILLHFTNGSPITPSEVSNINMRYGKRYYQFPAGTSNLTATVAANTGAQRTANITFRSKVNTSVTKTLHIEQAGATGNILVDTPTINVDYLTHPVTVNVTSFGSWSVLAQDTWITSDLFAWDGGTKTVTLTIADNTSNDARTGTITFYNNLTGDVAVVTVNQGGAPASIGLSPFRTSGSKAGGDIRIITCVSGNSWTMGSAPSWVAVSPTSGASGTGTITVTFDTPNNTGAKRNGQLRIENTTTHEIAICLITQEG